MVKRILLYLALVGLLWSLSIFEGKRIVSEFHVRFSSMHNSQIIICPHFAAHVRISNVLTSQSYAFS